MSVSTVRAAIAQVAGSISGVKRAFAYAPASLVATDLPVAVVFTGPATYLERGYGVEGETREYLLRLYVAAVQQGLSGDAESLCIPFFAAVRAAFPPGARLGRLSGVLEARLTGDQGVSILPFLNQPYLGIEFRVEVTE